MARKYAILNQEAFYFVTFTVIHWIDVFTREDIRHIFIDSLKYCQKEKGLLVGAWCIMTNHVHLILGTQGDMALQDIIRDLKSFTSRHIRKYLEGSRRESRRTWMLEIMTKEGTKKSNNKDFQLWQQHNHPIELANAKTVTQTLDYVHYNPVKAGFVDNPAEWVWSSARDYEDQKGIVDIHFFY